MLDSAREAQLFVRSRTRGDLDRDRMLSLALTRCIEIIGEAGANVSSEMKARYPNIPWTDIIGMRHRLTHAYFDIDLDRVWDTINSDLPPLIAGLEQVISQEEESGRR